MDTSSVEMDFFVASLLSVLWPSDDSDDISVQRLFMLQSALCLCIDYKLPTLINSSLNINRSCMQKYRAWTDEATGVNPFIKARPSSLSLLGLLQSAIVALLKINLVVLTLPLLWLSYFLRSFTAPGILATLVMLPGTIMNNLLGLVSPDDSKFRNQTIKSGSKGSLVLSNSVSVLDCFYFMSLHPRVKFIISSPGEEDFESLGCLAAVFRVLTDRQPFFRLAPGKGSRKFNPLIRELLGDGNMCVVFYEGIRTNGQGTIKISRKLSTLVNELEQDYWIAHLKYSSTPELLTSVVHHPFILLLAALGSVKLGLKVRCNFINSGAQHSGEDVQTDVDEFLRANATKLLQTDPASYFSFYQFYCRTQGQKYAPEVKL